MITDDNNHNSNNLVIDIVMKWLSFGFRQKYEMTQLFTIEQI